MTATRIPAEGVARAAVAGSASVPAAGSASVPITGSAPVPVVGFAAWSGTGKTTLLIKLIAIFTERRIRVGVIKHAHHSFEIDYPGKDSYELRRAGASQVLIGSKRRWALMAERRGQDGLSLPELLARLAPDELDLILVEGFKPESIPKIELHRPRLGKPLLFPDDDSIIALAGDAAPPELETAKTTLPLLDLNNPREIADFIIARFLPLDRAAPKGGQSRA